MLCRPHSSPQLLQIATRASGSGSVTSASWPAGRLAIPPVMVQTSASPRPMCRLPGTDYARTILGRRRHGTRGDLGRRRPGRRRQCRHLGVQGIALALVVGLQDDREVGLPTLGQVAVGERQPGREDWRAAGQGGSRSLAGPVRPGQREDSGDGTSTPPARWRSGVWSYARLSSSTGMVRTPAVWRSYSAKPG
jgi:hypothetical protein